MNRRKPIIYVSADGGISSITDGVDAATFEITKLNLELKSTEKNNKILDNNLFSILSGVSTTASLVSILSSVVLPFSPLVVFPLIYSLSQLIKKQEGQTSTTQELDLQLVSNDEEFSVRATQILTQLNLRQLQSLVETIPFSSLPEEFEFPPGHSLPESIYRIHPLKTKNKTPIQI